MRNEFSKYNPIICFIFYIATIVFGMCFINPIFSSISLIFSILAALSIKGKSIFKYLFILFPIMLIVIFMNPLFNHYGETILFHIFNNPYTLEALIYGVNMGVMFLGVMIWFVTFNIVMTTDKLTYILGNFIPSISLMLSMIIRFIPMLNRKVRDINTARASIGKGLVNDSRKERINNGMTNLYSLTSSALENGVVTADSMRARGYGVAKRTSFKKYNFKFRDYILLSFILLTIAITFFMSIKGGMKYSYEDLVIANSIYTHIGIISYTLLLAIPFFVNLMEEIKWHNLISRI